MTIAAERRVVPEAGQPGLPLAGLRVVELSSYVATPLCGLVLRQLGAEVIRVEPLGGAPDRNRLPRADDGTSLYWTGLNGGKRALAIDLEQEQGRELVADLICGQGQAADPGGAVVVSNSDRYPDLMFDALQSRRPDVVHALLTGTRDGRTAIDYTVQAASGFPMVTGPHGAGTPVNSAVPAWDVAAGLYLAVGILAAVNERGRTGRGQALRVALEDVAFATAGELGVLAEAQIGRPRRGPAGNEFYGSFGRDFVTSDGVRFMLVALTGRHWSRLLAGTGLTQAVAGLASALGADFGDEGERSRHRGVLEALLESWSGERTWAEAEPVLQESRAVYSVFRSFEDLVAHDAAMLAQMELFEPLEQPGVGRWLAPGSPLVMGHGAAGPSAAPRVGQHTDEVLASLGFDADRIARLRAGGCVA